MEIREEFAGINRYELKMGKRQEKETYKSWKGRWEMVNWWIWGWKNNGKE